MNSMVVVGKLEGHDVYFSRNRGLFIVELSEERSVTSLTWEGIQKNLKAALAKVERAKRISQKPVPCAVLDPDRKSAAGLFRGFGLAGELLFTSVDGGQKRSIDRATVFRSDKADELNALVGAHAEIRAAERESWKAIDAFAHAHGLAMASKWMVCEDLDGETERVVSFLEGRGMYAPEEE